MYGSNQNTQSSALNLQMDNVIEFPQHTNVATEERSPRTMSVAETPAALTQIWHKSGTQDGLDGVPVDVLNTLQRLHKRAGQLFSKMRFFSAQLEAYLEDDRWIRWAGHANSQAARLAEGLGAIEGISVLHPCEGNELFLSMPVKVYDAMIAAGFGLYPISPAGDGTGTIRLVTAFNTDPADVDRLLEVARGA